MPQASRVRRSRSSGPSILNSFQICENSATKLKPTRSGAKRSRAAGVMGTTCQLPPAVLVPASSACAWAVRSTAKPSAVSMTPCRNAFDPLRMANRARWIAFAVNRGAAQTLEVDEGADADGEGAAAGRRALLGRLAVVVFEQAVDLHARTQRVGGGEGDHIAVVVGIDVEKLLVIVAARPIDADRPGLQTVGGADTERLPIGFGEADAAPAGEAAAHREPVDIDVGVGVVAGVAADGLAVGARRAADGDRGIGEQLTQIEPQRSAAAGCVIGEGSLA